MSGQNIENFKQADTIPVENITCRVMELREQRDNFDSTKPVGPASNLSNDEAEELSALEDLLEEISSAGGPLKWEGAYYPAKLIARAYFVTYAEQYARDIGAISEENVWPHHYIDWTAAADNLEEGHDTIDLDGVEFLYAKF